MPKTFTISAAERLKSRKQIDELFRSGRRFNNGPFRVSWLVTAGEAGTRFGIGAGTRNFPKATDRNRIKRLAREAWRLQNVPLRTLMQQQNRLLEVFVIYTGKDIPEHALVNTHFSRIIENLYWLLNEKNSADT